MEMTEKKSKTFKGMFLSIKENRLVSILSPFAFHIFIFVVLSVFTDGKFITPMNLKQILDQALITGVVATGAAFIFGTGNVNIAMGSCTALTCTIAAKVYLATESIPAMFITALLFGVLLLVICALLSTVLHVKVMFVTIVMMVLLSSIRDTILSGTTLLLPYAMTSGLKTAGWNYIIFGSFFLLCVIIFHFT